MERRRVDPSAADGSTFALMSAAAVGRIAAGWLEAGRGDVDSVLRLAEHAFGRVAETPHPEGSRAVEEAAAAALEAAEACRGTLHEASALHRR